MLLGKRAKDSELMAAFIGEARTALPTGFAYLSIDDVRRVEDLIAQYGDSAAAMKELADLIAG